MFRATLLQARRGQLGQTLSAANFKLFKNKQGINALAFHKMSKPTFMSGAFGHDMIMRLYATGDGKGNFRGGIISGDTPNTNAVGGIVEEAKVQQPRVKSVEIEDDQYIDGISMRTTPTGINKDNDKTKIDIGGQDVPPIGTTQADKISNTMPVQSKYEESDNTRQHNRMAAKTGKAQMDKPSNQEKFGRSAKENDLVANLPSKEQVEKFFFRVVAFIYDLTYLTANWTIRFIDQKFIQNETVQIYWKKFHEKMQQAKKD